MRIRKLGILLPLLLTVLIVPACETSEAVYKDTGNAWTVGYGEQQVVPEDLFLADYYIAGYNVGLTIDGMLDPPYVKALWLDDNTGRGGVAIAVVDSIGLSGPDIRKIRARLAAFAKETGARAIHVISTHTHAASIRLDCGGRSARADVPPRICS